MIVGVVADNLCNEALAITWQFSQPILYVSISVEDVKGTSQVTLQVTLQARLQVTS